MMPANDVNNAPIVEVHIAELALHDVAPRNRQRVGGALAAELERLLSTEGIPSSLQQSITIDDLAGIDIEITSATRPETVGYRVARAIYTRLKR